MDDIEKLVQGSIDMHIHHGPDAPRKRRVDALQAALQAEEMGMRAIVLKSHNYPTAPLAYIVSQFVHNLTVFGSLSLDYPNGGLNPHAVEISALLGAKVVWMPTFSSVPDMERHGLSGQGIKILDEKGMILPEVQQILDIIKSHEMVLATGHIKVAESFALVDEAKKKGITKIVITHPSSTMFGDTMSIEKQRQMADKGAFIEHCFSSTMPLGQRVHPMEIAKDVRAVGAEHCILTTDLGQDNNPPPAEGMRMMVVNLLRCELSVEEMELMIKVNPAKLLGLT